MARLPMGLPFRTKTSFTSRGRPSPRKTRSLVLLVTRNNFRLSYWLRRTSRVANLCQGGPLLISRLLVSPLLVSPLLVSPLLVGKALHLRPPGNRSNLFDRRNRYHQRRRLRKHRPRQTSKHGVRLS